MENDIKTGEALAAFGIAAAVATGGAWLYRRSKPTTSNLTMLNKDQLAQLAQTQLPAPEEEEEEIHLAQLTEEEIIRLGQMEEEEEEIHLAKLSLREQRRQGGGITIL